MSYFFEVKHMSVGYHHKPVVEDINITLEKGEILTLIGPNGAGKSTILKSIARQLEVLSGTAYIGDSSIADMTREELAKSMSVVFTSRLQAELMSCKEVVESGRYPYTGRFGILSDRDHEMVREAMELVDVERLADVDFYHISDGQRQRVMLARAICQEPDLLVLDEPTSFLDIRYKLEFLAVLQKLCHQKGLTVVMSMHELDLAQRISDKVLCIKNGYVDRFGKAEEVFCQGYIHSLFDIAEGSFDEPTGLAELARPDKLPRYFVIAGGGLGRAVYRCLQRQGEAFYTGILYDNDLDYPVARALSAQVVSVKAFHPMDEQAIVQAKALIDQCEKIIVAKSEFGEYDLANKELLFYAKSKQKEIENY